MIGHWQSSNKFDPRALALYERHYSCRQYADGRIRRQFMAPGETMVLLTSDCSALWGWHHSLVARADGQEGISCAVFRNEGDTRSSELIAEACGLAWDRWPGARLFTYVNPAKLASAGQPGARPGWCFLKAGFRDAGTNKDGKLVLLERTS